MKPDGTKGELKFLSPQILPGDEAILFTITHTPFPTWEDDTEVVVQVLASGERKVLVHGGADATLPAVRSPALPSEEHLDGRAVRSPAVGRNRRGRRADPGCHAISEHAERGLGERSGSIQRFHRWLASLCGGRHVSRSGTFVGVGRQERRSAAAAVIATSVSERRGSHPTASASSSGRRETATSGCTISHAA